MRLTTFQPQAFIASNAGLVPSSDIQDLLAAIPEGVAWRQRAISWLGLGMVGDFESRGRLEKVGLQESQELRLGSRLEDLFDLGGYIVRLK